MKKAIVLFISIYLIVITDAKSCICGNFYSYDNLSELKEYEFIAHAKVLDEVEYEKSSPSNGNSGSVGLLKIQVIELFQGKMQQEIFEGSMFTSCDLGVNKGEEWLFFGKIYKGKIFVHLCDRHERYREVDGLRNWRFYGESNILSTLQKMYNHPYKTYEDEIRKEFYENGQIELETSYKNGKLNGEMKMWYPNGVLRSIQYFKNDTLQGKNIWFYPSGQIEREKFYRNGFTVNISKDYYDSTITKHPIQKKYLMKDEHIKTEDSLRFLFHRVQESSIRCYNDDGRLVFSKHFSRIGQLKSETSYFQHHNNATRITYHDNGVVSSIGYILEGNFYGTYQIFDRKGVLQRTWEYDNQGKAICPTNDCVRVKAYGEFE
jgi:antitoxin component YwqK of YwqJK toxin-antitoxin module